MTLSIIVAVARNWAIGKNNDLLYHLPNDMKHFKEITTGHTVLMGKNTFASFPKRPLPLRRNVVLALPDELPDDREGAEWVTSLQGALQMVADDGEVFVIGGAYVYKQCLPLADKLYLTFVDDAPTDADVYFPEVDFDEWRETQREDHEKDERHRYDYSFREYVRR